MHAWLAIGCNGRPPEGSAMLPMRAGCSRVLSRGATTAKHTLYVVSLAMAPRSHMLRSLPCMLEVLMFLQWFGSLALQHVYL